eukprot:CAMPEP_0168192194 /NCGR_PEP_ID=MMETSP0139_2-20121125/17916_1 /TAXON_ID=44445 /ORGANISM="Pseudo-nitzschia australis, Strain 10249 10 AB" /LENGTH=200 /DNA_ID=CAMNT_0008115413 /DNA_START=193 /DNA_END=795 /DNA_ORIENTATION=-
MAALLISTFPAQGQEANTTSLVDNDSSLESNSTEEPTVPIYYCKGICGEGEEGELTEPDLVVGYQWNLRVPVCSGVSCESSSCGKLSKKLATLDVTAFQCRKHQKELQYTAGCTCSEPSQDDDFGMGNDDAVVVEVNNRILDPIARWSVIVVLTVLFVAIWIGFWLGVRHDDKQNKNGNSDKEVMPDNDGGNDSNESESA